ncbi:MAG: TspO/MBR family protein [Chthoniobacterales bacterium]|jgi:benzodiazapine receptor
MKSAAALAGWIALTFCAALTGVFVQPAGYYAQLVKPAWAPPAWLFGPVWTLLYVAMALAAWLVWRQGGWRARRGPLALYVVQLALNALWTPVFFGLRHPGFALVEIVVLGAAIVLTGRAFRPVSRLASWLLVPYLVWVVFAAALNFAIWRLN